MFRKPFLLLFYLSVFGSALLAQEKWKFQIVFGDTDFGPVNTFMYASYDKSNTIYQLHSLPDADRRIFGSGKSALLRLLNKVPKKGIFLTINDIEIVHNNDETDSLIGNLIMPMLGKNIFKGIKKNDTIHGSFYSINYNVPIFMTGYKTIADANFDYKNLPQHIFDTTQKYLFNTSYLNTRQWKKFKSRTRILSTVAADDIEWFFGFNINSQKLPFSHYNLTFNSPPGNKKVNETNSIELRSKDNVFFKEANDETALLEVKSFSGGILEMDSVFSHVLKHKYKNLIIDLRNNPGGGLTSANQLGEYLVDKQLDIGFFVTNKWYTKNEINNFDLESLPVSEEITTEGLRAELLNIEGCKLIIKPGKSHYDGKIFVLTSRNTASTCEPMVYALKTNDLATVVGENTAGAMLSASNFHIMNNFYIFMAQADYYTPDKTRIDQVGVAPNIKVPSEEAYDYVLKLISEQENGH
ncbi:MAG: hypothetical protein CVT92_16375 [Bacteroidetes bacterium HGW-Bacteroidetes-1]|jgi:hypothetical protein|nr:MAG: hypothetical protein CVT92_16375 [Bacteroidetes bacterium HGW-Bacteroidetes-1]